MRLGLAAVTFLAFSTGGAFAQSGAFTWTGFYIGGHAGLSAGSIDFPATDPFYDTGISGGVIGVQGGYGIDLGSGVILGVEGTFSLNTLYANQLVDYYTDINSTLINQYEETAFQWSGTIAGRLGFEVADNLLVYGKAGIALASYTAKAYDNPGPAETGTVNNIAGALVGIGLEYAINDQVSIGTEYTYTNYGTSTRTNQYTTYNTSIATHAVTLNVNYHPDWM